MTHLVRENVETNIHKTSPLKGIRNKQLGQISTNNKFIDTLVV